MPRGNDIRSKSTRFNWTNQPHYQMHGGPKNRSGYSFKRGWENSVFENNQIAKIRSYASKKPNKSNNKFPGTTNQDVLLRGDKNNLGMGRFGKWGRGRWSDGLLDRPWLRSRTDKFLLRGMHVGSEEDCANIIRALESIDNPDSYRNAPPELRKRYEEARKFFLEEGGLKVSVGRTITGGHWKPWKWRGGLRGTKIANFWRRDREGTVASLARDRIREATIAAYAKTRSVEFAKHVKEQMLATLLDKKDGVRELDKLFQCAKDAQWVNGSWKERDTQQFKDKYRREKRDAAPEFFKIHDAVVYGDPSKLSKVVKDGAANALDIIDKVDDPSYYQMHGDPQGQNRYRLKAGWACSDLGRAQSIKNYNTFLKETDPDNYLKGDSDLGFYKDRWPGLRAATNQYLQQQMEVGTPADRERIRKNLNGILSGLLNLENQNVSKQQAKQDAAAYEFFFNQGGLKVRIGRTRSGGHWAPWKWRRGVRGERHVNLYRTAREETVAKAARQRIREATIAAYAKTDSLEFAKHVKEQMLAALLEQKMDGRPLDKLFKCSKNAMWEKPKSWFSWKKSSSLRRANKYDVEKREAAPEFFNIYDAVTYGKPSELRYAAKNRNDIKYDIDLSKLPSNVSEMLARLSNEMKNDESRNSLEFTEDKDSVKEDISVKNISAKDNSVKKSSISVNSRDNNSDFKIIEEDPNSKKRESLHSDPNDIEKPNSGPKPEKVIAAVSEKENDKKKQVVTLRDSDDSGNDTDSIYSDKDSNYGPGPDNRRQSVKIVDANSDIDNNDGNQTKTLHRDTKSDISSDDENPTKPIIGDGVRKSISETRSSKMSIPDMEAHLPKGEHSKDWQDLGEYDNNDNNNNDNDNNNDDKSIRNAEEWKPNKDKDKDGD